MGDSGSVSGADDSLIFPEGIGKRLVYIGKEVLLTRLTDDFRSPRKHKVTARFFELSADRGHYLTDAYVVAEVVSAFRSRRNAQEALSLYQDIKDSDVIIYQGSDAWDEPNPTSTPKQVLDAAAEFIGQYPSQNVSLQEATLIIQALRQDALLYSYDGPVRDLGRRCGLDVYPLSETVY